MLKKSIKKKYSAINSCFEKNLIPTYIDFLRPMLDIKVLCFLFSLYAPSATLTDNYYRFLDHITNYEITLNDDIRLITAVLGNLPETAITYLKESEDRICTIKKNVRLVTTLQPLNFAILQYWLDLHHKLTQETFPVTQQFFLETQRDATHPFWDILPLIKPEENNHLTLAERSLERLIQGNNAEAIKTLQKSNISLYNRWPTPEYTTTLHEFTQGIYHLTKSHPKNEKLGQLFHEKRHLNYLTYVLIFPCTATILLMVEIATKPAQFITLTPIAYLILTSYLACINLFTSIEVASNKNYSYSYSLFLFLATLPVNYLISLGFFLKCIIRQKTIRTDKTKLQNDFASELMPTITNVTELLIERGINLPNSKKAYIECCFDLATDRVDMLQANTFWQQQPLNRADDAQEQPLGSTANPLHPMAGIV